MKEEYIVKILVVSSPTETGKIFREDVVDLIVSQFHNSTKLSPGEIRGVSSRVNMERVSHFVKKMWVETNGNEKCLKATVVLSKTRFGKFLEKYIDHAFWGIRYSGRFEDGSLVVSTKRFEFIALDVYGFSPGVREKIWSEFSDLQRET